VSIPNEALEAATAAIRGVAQTRDFRVMAESAIEAAAPYLLKDMRRLSLYEIEMRDNPELMRATRKKMRQEAREVRAEEKRLWAEQARFDREAAREAMEADLNKHFPLIEDHLDDGYEVTCDATGCNFATGIGHYGAIMSKWNGHIAEVLSIAGSPK
jgi:hypothetical protein